MAHVLDIASNDYFTRSEPAKSEEIVNRVEVVTSPIQPAADPSEVWSGEGYSLASNASITLEVEYKNDDLPYLTTGASATVTPTTPGANVAVTSATYYAFGASITIKNNEGSTQGFSVSISAKQFQKIGSRVSVAEDYASQRENGLLVHEYKGNHLIQTDTIAAQIAAKLLAGFKDARKDVEIEWRGNPALELKDVIRAPVYIKHGITQRAEYYVYRQQHEYDGTYKSQLSGRKVS